MQRCSRQEDFAWSSTSRSSRWCSAPSLQPMAGEPPLHCPRILCLVGDEGSEIWAMFCFMASHLQLRCFFHRDPLHRLSNAFCGALRKTKKVCRSKGHVPRTRIGANVWFYIIHRLCAWHDVSCFGWLCGTIANNVLGFPGSLDCLLMRGMSFALQAFEVVSSVLLIHKYKRAPFGSGKSVASTNIDPHRFPH